MTQAPVELQILQKWFVEHVTRRLTADHTIQPLTKEGSPISEEARRYILPSKTLQAHQRLELYNQGYWWRLSDALISSFPLVARLFGARDFHETFVLPYLEALPSTHWDMNFFGDTFVEWLRQTYHERDRELVLHSAEIDWAMQVSFFIAEEKPLDTSAIQNLLTLPLGLQAHVQLFQLPFDLFAFREEFMQQDVNFGIENDFPELERTHAPYFFVLSRNAFSRVEYRQLSEAEFLLWNFAKKGSTIAEIANNFEKIGGNVYEEANAQISHWLQEGIGRKWLTYSKQSL